MTLFYKFLVLSSFLALPACTHPNLPPPIAPSFVTINAEGQAAMTKNSKLLARRLALQDAIRHAAMQSGAIVKSQTRLNQGSVMFDTFSMRVSAAVNHSQILEEWQENNIYHVRANITLSNMATCQPQYRKRLIATGFPLVHPEQLSSSETQDLASGIPREIMHQLVESQDFIGFNHTHTSLYAQPDLAPNLGEDWPYTYSKAMQIANDEGGQLVLSGVIRDLKLDLPNDVLGNNWMALAKSLARSLSAKRSVGVDIYVHDGFTGALLTQYRYTDELSGDVWIPSDNTVGSIGFKKTLLGTKISQIIEVASADLRQTLSCYPFTTRIIKVDGNKIFIDAGAQENLNIGDQLVVYAQTSEELHLEGNHQFVGRDNQAMGVLTLREIRPRYAIGELEVPAIDLGIQEGDWVKSW